MTTLFSKTHAETENKVSANFIEFSSSLERLEEIGGALETSDSEAAVINFDTTAGAARQTGNGKINVSSCLMLYLQGRCEGADLSYAIEMQANRHAQWLSVKTGTITAGADDIVLHDSNGDESLISGAFIRIKLWGTGVTGYELHGVCK